ncbi:MAG: Re/Si-specific NAD(P)(+) transhydrogenase subunit alpha [Methylophilaceae bacterium]|nr:Re/Si-specific NAD(P)(+) transhydrogenase subunit alpha [Methylophilaceae bacterium]
MKIGVLKENKPNEKRVAITPSSISKLKKLGYDVYIEQEAGLLSNFKNSQYKEAGANLSSIDDIYRCDILLKINKPTEDEIQKLSSKQTLISFFSPAVNQTSLELCKKDEINVLSMDSVPRISRAQKMDALSSMANVAGSRAVIEAAHCFGRFFGGQITAAGKINPAKILIIGAGVAGLSAIGTATSLGAIVRAFDTRPEVKEQVESLGAEFLTVNLDEDGSSSDGYAKVMSDEFIAAEMALFKEQAAEVDVIITTALIPGKEAPKLITKEMVEVMKPGSVIVDLASQQGGNCELCEKDKIVNHNGVNIIGFTDLPSRLPSQSSELYSNNLYHILDELTPNKDGNININMDDDVIRGMTIINKGSITYPPPKIEVSVSTKKEEKKIEPAAEPVKKKTTVLPALIALSSLFVVGAFAPASFMNHFTVFVLSCFVGYMVIWNVTASLHTPLMSVTNAVSSIIIIGAITQISTTDTLSLILSGVAVFIASINIFGGFAVTKRMLGMFRK